MDEVERVEDDTQPEETENTEYSQFTQSPLEESHFWGRLYPLRVGVKAHDLVFDSVKVGRLEGCDIVIGPDEMPDIFHRVSKEHFIITRKQVSSKGAAIRTPTTRVFLEDLSSNGTFINGQKVKEPKQLKSNDLIAVSKPEHTIFVFMESNLPVASEVPRNVRRKYDVSIRLGNGAFGDVTLVFNKVSCQPLAMKSIIKGLNFSENKLENSSRKLDNELNILLEVNHPNVIRLVDVVDCKKEKYLILEYMEGKDLFQRIKEKKKLSEALAKLYFFQISRGVDYLHSKGIIHRDLKPANILLASSRDETTVKITDFGLSKILNSQTLLQTLCGTKMYVAPEVLLYGGLYEYTEQVDIWSMGVILFVCLSGTEPFSVESNLEEQIKRGMYSMPASNWKGVSPQAKALVESMMTLDAEDRITINGILKDIWFDDDQLKSDMDELLNNHIRTDSGDTITSSSLTLRSQPEEIMSPQPKRRRQE